MRYCLSLIIAVLLSACSQSDEHVIVNIPEASGISYCKHTDTLSVVNDEGMYYEITRMGKIRKKVKLGKFDLEGIVCKKKKILFVREDKGVFILNKKSGKRTKLLLDTFYQGETYILFKKKRGIEGVAKAGTLLYLAKQSKKKEDSFVVVIDLKTSPARIVQILKMDMVDISGLSYHDKALFMVSDKEDLLIQYDIKKKKIIKKIKLDQGSWEGIAFDTKGNVYLADDDGRVLKYKKKDLGL